jgi:hypothetical protein
VRARPDGHRESRHWQSVRDHQGHPRKPRSRVVHRTVANLAKMSTENQEELHDLVATIAKAQLDMVDSMSAGLNSGVSDTPSPEVKNEIAEYTACANFCQFVPYRSYFRQSTQRTPRFDQPKAIENIIKTSESNPGGRGNCKGASRGLGAPAGCEHPLGRE